MYFKVLFLLSLVFHFNNAHAVTDGDACSITAARAVDEHRVFYCDGSTWHESVRNLADGIIADTITATKFIGDGSGLTNLPNSGLWSDILGNAVYSAGNVGIGTSTPTFALDVSGSTRIVAGGGFDNPPLTIQSDSLAIFDITSYGLEEYSNFGSLIRLHGAAGSAASPLATPVDSRIGQIAFRPHDGTNFLSSSANIFATTTENTTPSAKGTKLEFSTTETGTITNTTRMTIADNGKVGIGTAEPEFELHVIGEANGSTNALESYSDIYSQRAGFLGRKARGTYASPQAIQSGDNILSLTGQGYDGSDFSAQGNIFYNATENWSTTNKGLQIVFRGTDTGTNVQETWMTLKDSNVGIGTAEPNAKLDVNGEIKIGTNDALVCDASKEGVLRFDSTEKSLKFCDGTDWANFAITSTTSSDPTPDTFSFTDLTDQSLSSMIYSSNVPVVGFDGPVIAEVSGAGSPEISINGGAWTSITEINAGDNIRVRMNTSSNINETRIAAVTVGDTTVNWSVTTKAGGTKIFVTSNNYNGNLGGVSGADLLCQTEANNQGYSGTWKAMVSDSTTDLKDRLIISYPVVRQVDNTVIDSINLWDGSLENTVDGSIATSIYTGTNNDGTKTSVNCNNWTSSLSTDTGTFGYTNSSNDEWLSRNHSNRSYTCNATARLLCISQ